MKDFTNAAVSSTEDTMVTLVRRRVVFDEMLITREEFNKLNEKIESDDDYEIGFEVVNQLIPEKKLRKGFQDLGNDHYVTSDQWYHFPEMDDFTYDETAYIAFPGDVTSFTDDALGFMFTNQPWGEVGETIQEASA